jgi:HupE / UreJ protein
VRRLLLVVLLLLSGGAGAHEIGTTQVRLTLHRDLTWSATITTAPQATANKLEAEAGEPRSSDLDAAALRARLESLRPILARHVDVQFDGVPSPPAISIAALEAPADLSAPAYVVLTATGTIPRDAKTVTWRYGLSYSTYALVLAADEAAGTVTEWIDGGATSPPLPVFAELETPSRGEIIAQYLRLGFLHIIPRGLDHILFVLGLFLLNTRLGPILWQVTAFTIAHSMTLALTMYGVVSLSPRVVEPLIALSVAYVAIENIATSRLTPWRPVLVFAFGLLHGMGFADVLMELRLPRGEFIPALISFNAGIELGQLTVIAIAFFSVTMWYREKPWYRPRFVVPACTAIAAVGLFWAVQRIVEF